MYYLWILAPKSMPIQIEWITASLGPSSVQLTLPLNSTKRPEMPSVWAGGNKVLQKNLVELLHCPLIPMFRWNGKLLPKIFLYPFCKLPSGGSLHPNLPNHPNLTKPELVPKW